MNTMSKACTLAAAALLLLAGQSALAAVQVIPVAQLSGVAPDSGQAQFDTAAGRLTLTEADTATMTGSDLFGFEGLWLGSSGVDGRYTLSFSRPLASLSLDFIALSALAGEGTETLGSFVTDAPVSVQVRSADGSVSWLGGAVVPSEEDGRATLTLSALGGSGFTQWRFVHSQPVNLAGFVVQSIALETLSAVPEPATATLWLLGALALAGQGWCRGRARRPGPPDPRAGGAVSVSIRTDLRTGA